MCMINCTLKYTELARCIASLGSVAANYLEWTDNEVLLCSTGNYIQPFGIKNNWGKKTLKNIYIYICITGSLCYTAETDQHGKSTTLP